jgi:transcriptional regulator with XRE-family HTH domain
MFGDNLKKVRETTRLSQSQLAELLSVSQQTVGSWEVNRTSPPPETIVQISNVLNVSTDYLLGISNVPNKPLMQQKEKLEEDSDIKAVTGDYKKLSPEDKYFFKVMLRTMLEREALTS